MLDHYETQAPQCDPTPRGGYSSKCQDKPKCSVASHPVESRFVLVDGAAVLLRLACDAFACAGSCASDPPEFLAFRLHRSGAP